MKKHIILLSIILASCSPEKKENNMLSIFPLDTVKSNSEIRLEHKISGILKILNERSIRHQDTIAHEFRCYYFPPYRENNLYFKLNYLDSVLTIKEFQSKYPDGSGSEGLLKSQQIKLDINDFKTITRLVTKSMFWSLESVVYPYISIDGETFIYECRQPMPTKRAEVQKNYHAVEAAAPQNVDFVNLGHFFLLKAGHKNNYKTGTWQ